VTPPPPHALTEQIDAFMRMIWVRKVRCIVMVTGFVEGGKQKCERYFPDEGTPLKFGGLTVRSERVIKGPEYHRTVHKYPSAITC
jgi:protein tyrosine phosphatase